jgi:nucleotidyltransferase substrate binding protein (TIGR01987 family)
MTLLEARLTQFESALSRFRAVLKEPKTDIVRDSAIKRFEFTFDLCWKLIKTYLQEKKGVVCVSPKDCFRAAYRQGMIDYDEAWIRFVDLRNETTHTYREEMAERVYGDLPTVLKHFESLLSVIHNG